VRTEGQQLVVTCRTVSSTIRTLKFVSISTALLTLIGSPLYLSQVLGTSDYAVAKVASATGFTLFGLFTTGVLPCLSGKGPSFCCSPLGGCRMYLSVDHRWRD
jgi:hypothetical protein